MKRNILTFILVLICFLLQGTLFKVLSFGSVAPNLLVIITASVGFIRGKKEGMTVGLLCGLLFDLFWGYTLGLNMLIFTLIGYLNGEFHRLFFEDDIKFPLLFIGGSELCYGLVSYVFIHMLRGDFELSRIFFSVIVPELVYTILITLVLYQIILRLNKRLEEKEQRSASKFV